MTTLRALQTLDPERFESKAILKKMNSTSRALAELKGVASSIPHQGILINTLGMQEAKDSSAIENIVTTHDDLFRDDAFPEAAGNLAAKEVLRYRQALRTGFISVQETGLLTSNQIIEIQTELERNNAGFRRLSGTTLKDSLGRMVYTPPQSEDEIIQLMRDLENFINDDSNFDADPLVKMALIHHQFESIHPFYDGNGRTGRIINVLYLLKCGLLDIPVLYLSRYIVQHKSEYYRLLQAVREDDVWEDWVLFILTAVETTAQQTIATILAIKEVLMDYKHRIREQHKFYSQDLINNLFSHPYTKIEFVMNDLNVSRITATNYLNELVETGFVEKRKVGRSNYYINIALNAILTGEGLKDA